MPAKPESIDDYLASVPADRRSALEQLRRTIHALLPRAEECISYSMPAFRHDGHVVAGFLATAKGCSYFPFSGTTLATLESELSAYSQTKSALHFQPGTPLPKLLVKKLLAARIAEQAPRAPARKAATRSGKASAAAPKGRATKRAVPAGKRVVASKSVVAGKRVAASKRPARPAKKRARG